MYVKINNNLLQLEVLINNNYVSNRMSYITIINSIIVILCIVTR